MVVVVPAENAVGISFRVIELPPLEKPEESRQPHGPEKQGNGDQNNENIHQSILSGQRRRSAFSDTVIELVDIAKAAIRGVAKPAMAKGTAMIL